MSELSDLFATILTKCKQMSHLSIATLCQICQIWLGQIRCDFSLHLVRFVIMKLDNSDTMLSILRCDISWNLIRFVLTKSDNSDTMLPFIRCDISLHLVRFVLIGQFWHNFDSCFGILVTISAFVPIARCKVSESDYN